LSKINVSGYITSSISRKTENKTQTQQNTKATTQSFHLELNRSKRTMVLLKRAASFLSSAFSPQPLAKDSSVNNKKPVSVLTQEEARMVYRLTVLYQDGSDQPCFPICRSKCFSNLPEMLQNHKMKNQLHVTPPVLELPQSFRLLHGESHLSHSNTDELNNKHRLPLFPRLNRRTC